MRNPFSNWGTYELWVSVGGTDTSLFMPHRQTKEGYHLLTHSVEDQWEWDRMMVRIGRFWSPGFWFATKIADILAYLNHTRV